MNSAKQDPGSKTVSPHAARALSLITSVWSWLFLIFIIVFFEVWAQVSYGSTFIGRVSNMQSILIAATPTLLLALGLTLVIVAAGIDLSIGFVAGLSAVVTAVVIRALGPDIDPWLSLLLGVLSGIGVSIIPGLFNGWLVAHLRVPSFIGTLGMYGIARGMAFLIAGGATVPIRNQAAVTLGNGSLWYIPYPVLVTAVLVLVFHYLLSSTRFGLYTYAMGGNFQSAVRAGVDVKRQTLVLFMLSAFTAGIGGILYTTRFSAGAAQAGEPVLLYAVAAVFIGGASLTGGSGTIMGTVIGSLIIAVIQFGLVFINVAPYWQFIAVGLVIIVAVLIDQSRNQIKRGG